LKRACAHYANDKEFAILGVVDGLNFVHCFYLRMSVSDTCLKLGKSYPCKGFFGQLYSKPNCYECLWLTISFNRVM